MANHNENTQRGRTAFWENLREKNEKEYQESSAETRFWHVAKRRELEAIRSFIAMATVVIDQSRQIDERLQNEQSEK